MPSHQESLLQEQVCNYLKFSYPSVIFRSDFASGLKMTMGQAIRHRRIQSGRAWPDLFIYEPKGDFHGLALELKADGVTVYLKNGSLASNPHLREQADVLDNLTARGYSAHFAVGFNQAKQLIDEYLTKKAP